jgi:hypothetical protein
VYVPLVITRFWRENVAGRLEKEQGGIVVIGGAGWAAGGEQVADDAVTCQVQLCEHVTLYFMPDYTP